MFDYFKKSFQQKLARRVTREYPPVIGKVNLAKEGPIDFANWANPLVAPFTLTQSCVDFFRKFVKEGDLAIDIGANIGDTTVPMALAAGKTGLALGFDPNPYVFKILEANARLNKDKANIVPLPYAISKEEDEFYFISSEASFGNGGISTTRESPHGKFVHPGKIKGIDLSKFLESQYPEKLNRLSFIKIDTEGYDKEIIKSIRGLIQQYKPVIVAESFGASPNEAKMELFEVIHRDGYQIFHFEEFDAGTKTVAVNDKEEMAKWKDTVNIYAVPVSR
ncbi:MAG TPA: FkbM family methyltransferase [Cyclobacteriaceae bacterium]|nr:FkbM family methyltransferase [Cyclobacteriaceae bacterium]